jgi:hypothetical protein
MIINGGIECSHGYEKPQAVNRQNYYRSFSKYFKVLLIYLIEKTTNKITRQHRSFLRVFSILSVRFESVSWRINWLS